MVTTDIIVLYAQAGIFEVLLIQRKNDPFGGMWALPGGFVDMNEDLEAAAIRELREETGIDAGKLEQLFTVGTPGRDPRGHTVSVIYYKVINDLKPMALAGDDAAQTAWFKLDTIPAMAFDHEVILKNGIEKIMAIINKIS